MITYFVLKDDEGKPAGCVRLENGRARSSCPCTLLLEDGANLALGAEETPLPARPLGAVVLRGETPAAWGLVPGSTLTKAELLCRLDRRPRTDPPPPKPEPEYEPDPEPEPEPEPLEPEPEPGPEPEPESSFPTEPDDSAALAADFGLLVRHAGEVYESILYPSLPGEGSPLPEEAPRMPEETAQEEAMGPENWFSETERLIARIRRSSRDRPRD